MSYNSRYKVYMRRSEVYGNICHYCSRVLNFDIFTLDHIVPVSRGGKTHGNIVACCQDCNKLKADMYIEEFRIVFFSHYGKPMDAHYPIVQVPKYSKQPQAKNCRVCNKPLTNTDFRRIHTKCQMEETFVPVVKERTDWNY